MNIFCLFATWWSFWRQGCGEEHLLPFCNLVVILKAGLWWGWCLQWCQNFKLVRPMDQSQMWRSKHCFLPELGCFVVQMCNDEVQSWLFFLFFLHCHFILPLSRLLIYLGGDAFKETLVNGKSPSILFCFEEQCSKGTSMHHKWQPRMPSNLRNGWNICSNECCSSKTLPNNNTTKRQSVEENV